MKIYEYPPILTGTPQEQLEQLRAYLIRLIQTINEADQTEVKK